MEYKRYLTLDVNANSKLETVKVKQGDASARFINIILESDGRRYFTEPGCTIVFRCEKPDGTGVMYDNIHENEELGRTLITLDYDDTICVELTDQVTIVPGRVKADIAFFKDERVLSSMPFIIEVIFSPNTSEQAVSTDDFQILQGAIADAYNFRELLDTKSDIDHNHDGVYLKEHQSLEDYALKTELPVNVSELENDSNYATVEYVDTATEPIAVNAAAIEALDESKMQYAILVFNGYYIFLDEQIKTFAEIREMCLDNKHFVYLKYSNRLYIPQYVNENNVFFEAAYIDNNVPYMHRIAINSRNAISVSTKTLATKNDVDELKATVTELVANKANRSEIPSDEHIYRLIDNKLAAWRR